MVQNLDINLGRVREALKRSKIDRETHLAFFSDHGGILWSHGQSGKSSPWEEAIRTPFVIGKVDGKDNMRTGATDADINHVDTAPSTLGLCGIPAQHAPEFKGRSGSEDRPWHGEWDSNPRPTV